MQKKPLTGADLSLISGLILKTAIQVDHGLSSAVEPQPRLPIQFLQEHAESLAWRSRRVGNLVRERRHNHSRFGAKSVLQSLEVVLAVIVVPVEHADASIRSVFQNMGSIGQSLPSDCSGSHLLLPLCAAFNENVEIKRGNRALVPGRPIHAPAYPSRIVGPR